MNLLLNLLLAFFRLGIDVPKDPPAEMDTADVEDPDHDPNSDPDDIEADPDSDPDEPKKAGEEELAAERRAREAEKARADRFEREAADLRTRHAPRQDDETAREDARLAAADTPELEKWQINANRSLRAGNAAAQTALIQAEDVRDQTQFSQLAVTEPALHKRYATRVEEELGRARQQGWNPKREVIYNQLIAKDMRDGKFKKKAAAAADVDKDKNKAVRGKLPGARSDVHARSGMSEREKRAKRLENVQI